MPPPSPWWGAVWTGGGAEVELAPTPQQVSDLLHPLPCQVHHLPLDRVRGEREQLQLEEALREAVQGGLAWHLSYQLIGLLWIYLNIGMCRCQLRILAASPSMALFLHPRLQAPLGRVGGYGEHVAVRWE